MNEEKKEYEEDTEWKLTLKNHETKEEKEFSFENIKIKSKRNKGRM